MEAWEDAFCVLIHDGGIGGGSVDVAEFVRGNDGSAAGCNLIRVQIRIEAWRECLGGDQDGRVGVWEVTV